MSKLLRVRVLAARAHVQPRRGLMSTKIPKRSVGRLTIMLNSDGKTKLHDDAGIGFVRWPKSGKVSQYIISLKIQ